MKISIDTKEFKKLVKGIDKIPQTLTDDAYTFFVNTTPIRTGNARRSTDLRGQMIVADYVYADRLDQGYSRQAPKGMTDPTIEYVEKRLEQLVGRIK
jgi:hypothetical protein